LISLLLAVAAGAAGALAGFVAGVAAAVLGIEGASEPLAALVVAVAVVADLAGRPRPVAVGRQVPRAWARVFPLRVAAVLYGARLGIGPFTILSTWLWWAAFVLGAALGPWWSAATGAAFGVGRVLLMVGVAARVEGDMPSRMATVRARERAGGRAALAGAVLAVGVLLAACTDGGDDARRPSADADGGDATNTTRTRPAPIAAAEPPVTVSADFLLADLGPEYRQVPDDRPGLGAIDLAEAASAEEDTSAETSLLLTRGFRGGVGRAWRTQSGDEVYEAVYEFRDEPSAAAYLKDGLITLEGRGAQLYPVEAVPGSTGFSQAERRAGGAVTSHGVAFVRGPRFFLVFASSARPGTTPAQASELARAADAKQASASASTAAS
jgi:hypothetical protein